MSFEIEIDDPRQIRKVSDRLFEIAEENNLTNLYVGLDHNHISIVRGQREDFRGLNYLDFEVGYPVEILRDDGGDSWIHSGQSRCYEKVEKVGRTNAKSHEEQMEKWGIEELVEEINQFLKETDEDIDIDPVYDSGDIYDANTGKQVAGLSMKTHGDYALKRMCFYDGSEHGEEFQDLIEVDMEFAEHEGLNLNDPREDVVELPGFYEHVMSNSEGLEVAYDDLEIGEPSRHAGPATYCVTRRPDLKNS